MSSIVKISLLFSIITILSFSQTSFAQVYPKERKVPLGMSRYKDGDFYTKVTFGEVRKKKRITFGNIVRFDRVWRVGAGEATEITFNQRVVFGKDTLAAGTYSLFIIPRDKVGEEDEEEEQEWDIILNSEVGMWGHLTYDKSKNVALYKTIPLDPLVPYEALTFKFEKFKGELEMYIIWDRKQLNIPIIPLGK